MKNRPVFTQNELRFNTGGSMSTIMPEGDGIKKAIKWIDQEKKDCPQKTMMALLDEAGMTFNLSPKDSDFLFRFFTKKD